MPTLKIPVAYRAALGKLIALPVQDMSALKGALKKASPSLVLPDMAKRIAVEIKLGEDETYEVMRVLARLYTIRARRQDVSLSEFAEEVCRAAQIAELKPAEGSWDRFKNDLQELLSFHASLGVTAKALEIARETERAFCSARILTDLRPVFREELDAGPAAAVILHNLRIAFHVQDDLQEFFVAMSTPDLRSLKAVVERAIRKEESLRKVAASAGLQCLETETH